MARLVWTRPAAEQLIDLLSPITAQDPEMGASLLRRIEACLERLTSFPDSAPFYRPPIRRITIHKLPYSCYYRLVGDSVRIIAIRHDKQRHPDL